MNVKNVVKVMNFHSLLRVDNARKLANKYIVMEKEITDMIDNIINNRNVLLDSKVLKVNKKYPVLNIYIGSDYGFCSNFNSLVNNMLSEDETSQKIIIGKKMRRVEGNVLFRMSREEFEEDSAEVLEYIRAEVQKLHFSEINIIYNHYNNATDIQIRKKQIFPLPKDEKNKHTYNEDFVCESDMNDLLVNLVTVYVQYEVEIAAAISYASENVFRQNTTTQSLKKIDEREEEQVKIDRRATREKQFKKTLESYTKINNY